MCSYQCRNSSNDEYVVELLHRAILHGDQHAGVKVQQCLCGVVCGWLHHHPNGEVLGCVSFFPSVQKLRTRKRPNPTSFKSLKILFALMFEANHLQLHALFLTGFGASLPPVLSSDAT